MCSKDRAKLNSEIEPGLLSGVLGADPPGCLLLQWVGSPMSCLRGAQAVGRAGRWELVWPWWEGIVSSMLQSSVFLPTPSLAKECSHILFRSPHPWLTLDDESKELNSSHVGAPSASGLNASVGTFH